MSRRRRRFVVALATLPLICFVAAIIAIDIEGHRDYARDLEAPADAIVILGAGVLSNGQASSTLRERTLHAVDLWKQGRAPYLLCTGGVGVFPPSEGRVAANLAIKHGVPRSKVLWEERSANTRQNAHFAADICRARNWTRVIIVSQPFHLPRAARYFRGEGLQVWPSPVPNSRVDDGPYDRFKWTAREVLSSLRDWFV